MRALTFCDVSPFYCPQGGGIRTYHRAKIAWFLGQPLHRYVLVHPGPRRATSQLGPTVTLEQIYGPPITGNREGYRLPADITRMWRAVARAAPDVLEVDDPWFSGPFGLLARKLGKCCGVLASFYHSDPIATYVAPAFGPDPGRVLGTIERVFFRLQARYDVTVVSSRTMERRVRDGGVRKTLRAPFGVHPDLFEIRREAVRPGGCARLLYAGRLHADKDAPLLLEVMPRLLARDGVRVSVAGVGPLAADFAGVSHPNFHYLGFVADAEPMTRIYETHDVLLAPGRNETFGLAALEAAAAGLVVVGPDRGATGELLREMQSPFVFTAGDADALAETVAAAIESRPADVVDVVERQRAVARRYGTWNDAIGRQVRAYEDLVMARATKPSEDA